MPENKCHCSDYGAFKVLQLRSHGRDTCKSFLVLLQACMHG